MLIDLTHTFTENMPVYPGDSKPEFKQVSDMCGKGCTRYEVKTSMHVGTHIDAPFHMLENGKRLSEINIERFFGNGILLDARGKDKIDIDLLEGKSIKKDSIVFIMTGLYKRFGSEDYYKNYPEITEAFAREVVKLDVKIVGIDTPSPDRAPFKIHKILLEKEILIIENLTNLEQLFNIENFEVIALPVKFNLDGAPVRVVAKII